VLLVTAIVKHYLLYRIAAGLVGGRNTFVLLVTAIVMHCAVI